MPDSTEPSINLDKVSNTYGTGKRSIILPGSYIIAVVLALVILLISQIPAIRQVYRLNLSTVTKSWSE